MAELIVGVVNDVPVPSEVPPDEASYQLRVAPALAVACNSTVPVPQREPGVVPVTVGALPIVAVTLTLIEVQPASVTST